MCDAEFFFNGNLNIGHLQKADLISRVNLRKKN
jgi:hypothetical protein